MNKDAKIIFSSIEDHFKKHGYINLDHRPVNSQNDLAKICQIFRDPRYETFRIIYMKGNKIAAYESMTTRSPNSVNLSIFGKFGCVRSEKAYYKVKNRMERLEADGYYLVHNHPSDDAHASNNDIRVTEYYAENFPGFLGHLIVNHETYAWIDIDKNGKGFAENYIPIKQRKVEKVKKKVEKDGPFSVNISSRNALIGVVSQMRDDPDFSMALLTNSKGKVVMALDFPNRYLNFSEIDLKNYFKNLAKSCGAIRVFFGTMNKKAYNRALKHFDNGTFKDCVCLKEDNGKLILDEAINNPGLDLFEEKMSFQNFTDLLFCEENQNYKNESENSNMDENNVEKIRVLYKQVGKPCEVKLIDNTLEAKQKLVGGLIEVVPYDEVLLICNEEGKLINLLPNLCFDLDCIVGDCFIIGDDYENGDFKSLTKEECLKYAKDLNKRSFHYNFDKNGNIIRGFSPKEQETQYEK